MSPSNAAAVAEVLAPWADADVVPFPTLATRAGVPRVMRRDVMDAGLVIPLPGTEGQGKTPLITKDDAALFVAAALIALAAGLTVLVVMRVLAQSGAEVGSTGVRIPLPSP